MVTHKTSTLFLSTCTRSFTNFVQSRCHTYRLAGSTYQSGLDSTTSMRLQGTMAATNASPHLPRSPCLTVMNQALEESLNPSGSSILLPISVVVFFFYSWRTLLFFIHTHYSFNPCLPVSLDTFIHAFPRVSFILALVFLLQIPRVLAY